jgi:hypothetical protein
VEGEALGELVVGTRDGLSDGDRVGECVGAFDGEDVEGEREGFLVGDFEVGERLGARLGRDVIGPLLGLLVVGFFVGGVGGVGLLLGLVVEGEPVGAFDGGTGLRVGILVGLLVGRKVVGCFVVGLEVVRLPVKSKTQLPQRYGWNIWICAVLIFHKGVFKLRAVASSMVTPSGT